MISSYSKKQIAKAICFFVYRGGRSCVDRLTFISFFSNLLKKTSPKGNGLLKMEWYTQLISIFLFDMNLILGTLRKF